MVADCDLNYFIMKGDESINDSVAVCVSWSEVVLKKEKCKNTK